MKKIIIFIGLIMLSGCQAPASLHQPVTKIERKDYIMNQRFPIIGSVEPVHISSFSIPFGARIDTGAKISSVDAQNITPFERDGEKWVSFDITNRKNNEKHHFEKPIIRKTKIKRFQNDEHRYVVNLNIKIGNEIIENEFSLINREKFDYQVLIGRNIISGRFIIDPSVENTLH